MTYMIDGKAQAQVLVDRLKALVSDLTRDGEPPGLAVVLVGDDPASQVYVANKAKRAQEIGIASFVHRLPKDVSMADLLEQIDALNAAPSVHGILVQLPLPKGLEAGRVLSRISPHKDVDGFHPMNAGLLAQGYPVLEGEGFVPCTPLGCFLLAREVFRSLSGLHAVIVGRSTIVGRPMAQVLLQADCTVTVAHSKTRDLPGLCREADLVVCAVGRPEMVRGSWIKPGACVIDVGINRDVKAGKSRLVGDCAFEECAEVAGAITPVPGGVGPMTIACLMLNTVKAACLKRGVSFPAESLFRPIEGGGRLG